MGYYDEVPGQLPVKENLKKIITGGKVSHAYIFSGARGCGKNRMAKLFAAALLCETGSGEPCGQCHSCRMALSDNHPDVITLSRSGKSGYLVNDVRDRINADVWVKPFYSDRKVYIIPEAQDLNIQSQNALLKTLEEPPSYVTLILVCDNRDTLLDTIRSRCVKTEFEQVRDLGDVELAVSLVKNISRRSIDQIIHSVSAKGGDLPRIKEKKNEILDVMTIWYRDVLYLITSGDEKGLNLAGEAEAIRSEAQRLSIEAVVRILGDIEKARARIKANVKLENVMESLLLDIRKG